MARLESQVRMGYYPIPLSVLKIVRRHITPCEGMTICDPCAGEGDAVRYLAHLLGVPNEGIVACELDSARSEVLVKKLPGANVTGSVDFQSARYAANSVSLMYLNPPYDGELGASARAESLFLSRAANVIVPGGLLVFVIPRRNVKIGALRTMINNLFYAVESFDFPSDVRKFDECVVIGYKRRKAKSDTLHDWAFLKSPRMATVYQAVPGETFVFRKMEYTDQELVKLINVERALESMLGNRRSGVRRLRPPLELGDGHKALLLAAGHLNGRIHKPGKPPHVVRGVSRKVERVKDEQSDRTHKTVVIEERIELLIRKVDQRGVIEDITDSSACGVIQETRDE